MSPPYTEILHLLARQAHAIDTGRAQEWAETFTEDGVFSSPTYPAPVRGRRALAEFAAAFARDNPAGRHVITNVWLDGPYARSVLLVLDGTRIVRVTELRDRLVERDGRRLIAERVVTLRQEAAAKEQPTKEQH
ncbi:nuclear transport factor 2 family protein [Nonomuraea sp. NPDC000554]|uniref:nuclear transport factor 2 family protein n=1 Tax=Nonomuraea sp. NPDC000554 TaxID=3154259 RepID=UPI00331B8F6C